MNMVSFPGLGGLSMLLLVKRKLCNLLPCVSYGGSSLSNKTWQEGQETSCIWICAIINWCVYDFITGRLLYAVRPSFFLQ